MHTYRQVGQIQLTSLVCQFSKVNTISINALQRVFVKMTMAQISNSAAYDPIAQSYTEIKKELPLALYVELPSMDKLIGSVQGLRVLDLGCGDGKYARLYKEKGASEVVGVDLSSEMIKIAADTTAASGVKFVVGDASRLQDLNLGKFDVVAASYLLNCASSVDILKAMITSIKACLKPNGRFVTINNNPFVDPSDFHLQAQYGYYKTVSSDDILNTPVGTPFKVKIAYNGKESELTDFYMPSDIIQKSFEELGFDFKYVKPTVFENPFPAEYWDGLKKASPLMLMEAILK